MESYPSCWCEINLKRLSHNLRELKGIIPRETKIMAVVKADAYGHGDIEVSKVLLAEGVQSLGVFSLSEGIRLREAKIRAPILILGPSLLEDAEAIIGYDLTPAIFTMEMAQALSKAAAARGRKVRVHVKINTGMWRIGVWVDEAIEFVEEVLRLKNLEIEGVFSHLATAYCADKTYAYEQFRLFSDLLNSLEGRGIHIPMRHIASSAAILDLPEMSLDIVRPGIALYGLYPSKTVSRRIRLLPVMEFKTRIAYLERVPRGSGISYGRTYIAPKDLLVAVLPVGYANGYMRILSGKAEVLVGGRRARTIGTICMDYLLVDVSEIEGLGVGDEVVLFGEQQGVVLEVDELAELAGTINYEIVCSVGNRVPRVYIENRE